jgi:quinol monooxygenase YgiN
MAEVNYIEWHVTPFRRDRFLEIWLPALDRALAFGARSCLLSRNEEDPLHFRQVSIWDHRADFDRYWASDEISGMRQEAMRYYQKPVYPVWHTLTAEAAAEIEAAAEVES